MTRTVSKMFVDEHHQQSTYCSTSASTEHFKIHATIDSSLHDRAFQLLDVSSNMSLNSRAHSWTNCCYGNTARLDFASVLVTCSLEVCKLSCLKYWNRSKICRKSILSSFEHRLWFLNFRMFGFVMQILRLSRFT